MLAARSDPEVHAGLFLDSAHYAEIAGRIRSGLGAGSEPYLLSPLYPYLLALFPGFAAPAGTNPLLAVRLAQALLGAGTCAAVAVAAGRVAGRRAAWLAGLAAAVHGPSIQLDAEVLVAGPQAFCIALALAMAPSSDGPGRRASRRWLAVGLALGAAAALRPTALAVAVAFALVLLARAALARSAVLPAVAVLAGAAAVVLPFAVRNRVVAGESVLLSANGGLNFWIGNHAGAPGTFEPPPGYDFHLDPVGRALAERRAGRPLGYAEASRWWRDEALEDVREAPGAWLALLGHKLLWFLHPREVPQVGADFEWHRERSWILRGPLDARWLALLAAAAPLAVALTGGRAAAARCALPATAALALAGATVLFFVTGRHRAPAMPAVIVLAGASAHALLAALADSRRRRAALGLAAGVAALGAASVGLYRPGGPFALEGSAGQQGRHAGVALMEQGRLEEAIATFREALRTGESTPTRVNLALALARVGRTGEAEAELSRALAADPGDARAAFELANLLVGPAIGATLPERTAARREAAALYRRALASQPRFAEAWFNLGAVLLNLRELDAAIEALEAALVCGSPGDPWRAEAERALAIAYDERRKEAAEGR